jgi:hypothetical protein
MPSKTTLPRNPLLSNNDIVEMARRNVAEGELNIKRIPGAIRQLIESGAWRERIGGAGLAHLKFNSFAEFVTTPPLDGMGWEPGQITNLLRFDQEVLTLWRQAVTAPAHRPKSGNNVPTKSKRPHRGNSLAWTLDRLAREHKALYAQVLAGKLSANQAAIKAGFRKPPTPLDQIKKLWRKLSAKDRAEFKRWAKTQ